MKALITGISGFVGSHLADHLLAHSDWQVAGTVYGADQKIAHIRHRLELYPAELSRLPVVQYILDRARPDVIFHLAAIADTGRSWRDPAATLQVNISMQANILQALVNLKLGSRVIVVGSSEEYGAAFAADRPITEETAFRPMNPYAVSKVTQDMLGLQYHLSHGLDTIRVRPFNHIGPRQNLGFVVPDFCSQIAAIETGHRPPVIRVGNLDAERDFTDVRDVVRAYHLLAVRGKSGEAYNVGSGKAHAVQEILDYLVGQSSVPIAIEPDPKRMRPSDVPRVVCDYGKLHACTAWEPRIGLATSLTDALEDWRTRTMNE